MGESDLLVGDEEELVTDDKDSLADTDEGSLDRIKMMHGQSCWPYPSISGNCSRPVTVDMDGCVDLQHDPYCLLKHFTTQWAVPMDQHRPVRGGTQFWSDWDWCFEAEGKHPGLRVDLSKFPRRGDTLFSDLISSQLLLYRIVTTFGAPPNTEEDGYKCAWSFTLLNKEDPTCALEIHDHKGWPQATFSGGERASTEALQLLDWLIGENCPHMYNYTLFGCTIHTNFKEYHIKDQNNGDRSAVVVDARRPTCPTTRSPKSRRWRSGAEAVALPHTREDDYPLLGAQVPAEELRSRATLASVRVCVEVYVVVDS
ncbi:hypothetical protein LA080_007218 [Diaporthe eres]|nr:hypothetical protein LA080_007218 [Diaporthe eres]